MKWSLSFLPEVKKDMKHLGGNRQILVRKAIEKVRINPLPASEGGYGKPLGNKSGTDLTGLLKIKLKSAGIRVVYKLIKIDNEMKIIVIGARADDEVYEIAESRARKHDL